MRILLISSSYPPVLGGLQTVVHQLAGQLTASGHQVCVITNRYPRSLPSYEMLEGIPVHRFLFLLPSSEQLRTGRPDLFAAGIFSAPLTALRLHFFLRRFRPDVINVHFPLAQNPFVLWLRGKLKFPLVVSLHGNEILTWFGASDRPFHGASHLNPAFTTSVAGQRLKAMLNQADAVTACSRWLLSKAAVLEPSVAAKGTPIHNGIDARRFQQPAPPPPARPYIFAFGRLTFLKGFDMLLEAFATLAAQHPGVDLIIGGAGEELLPLTTQAEAPALKSRVIFTGRLDPAAVATTLLNCLFLVVPSRCEPFGIVALEGLAAGKPVLAADAGGIAEIPGVHLVPSTAQALGTVMAAWLEHPPPPTEMPHPAAFSAEAATAQYLAVYRTAAYK